MKRWWIPVGALVVIAGGFLAWRARDTGAEVAAEGQSFRIVQVRRGAMEMSVSATGVVQPINRVEIKSKASGEVIELPIEEGMSIQRGDLIARLDATDARADLARAKADLEIAQIELRQAEREEQRQRDLFEKQIISEVDLDAAALATARARASLIRAQTEAERTQERFDETVVRSPVSGIVLEKAVEKGQIISSATSSVSGGTVIAAVADMGKVQVTAAVNEIDIGRIRVGQQAEVIPDAFAQRRFTGEVIRIAPEAQVVQNVTQFDVLIEVDNPEGILASGMNCSVTIVLTHKDDALIIPAEALLPLPAGTRGAPAQRTVLLKTGTGFEERAIQLGMRSGTDVEVVAGLAEGDELKVALLSRAYAENQMMQDRLREQRSFGATGSGQPRNGQSGAGAGAAGRSGTAAGGTSAGGASTVGPPPGGGRTGGQGRPGGAP